MAVTRAWTERTRLTEGIPRSSGMPRSLSVLRALAGAPRWLDDEESGTEGSAGADAAGPAVSGATKDSSFGRSGIMAVAPWLRVRLRAIPYPYRDAPSFRRTPC